MLGRRRQAARRARLVRRGVAGRARRQFYVGIERVEQIVRFDLPPRRLAARGEPIAVPADFKTFTYNKSLECLAAGRRRLAARRHADRRHRAQPRCRRQSPRVSAQGRRQSRRFSVKRSGDFDVSDCAVLPPADLLLLERRFSLAARARHAHPPHSARRHQAGRAGRRRGADRGRSRLSDRQHGRHRRASQRRAARSILTLVSDDNFSPIPAHAAAAVRAGGE